MAGCFGLSMVDLEKLRGVFERYPDVDAVIIYGSRAKGNYRAGSDIDITLKGKVSWMQFNDIAGELDDLLLPYSIDLSLYEHIEQAALKDHIDRVGRVLYVGQDQLPYN